MAPNTTKRSRRFASAGLLQLIGTGLNNAVWMISSLVDHCLKLVDNRGPTLIMLCGGSSLADPTNLMARTVDLDESYIYSFYSQ